MIAWAKRGAALSQDNILASPAPQAGRHQDATIFVVVPPPIRGLGQSGGFQMMVEDRESLGCRRTGQGHPGDHRAGDAQSGLRNLTTTFSARSPQLYLDIDRTKAQSLQVPLSNVFYTLQAYLGSSYRQSLQQVQPGHSRSMSRPTHPIACTRRTSRNLYVRNTQGGWCRWGRSCMPRRTLGTELVTRYNLYPAAPIFGIAAPGFSSGQALNLMEQVAQNTLPEGMAYDWTATAYQEKQVGNQAYFIYALSITLVFLALAALYESWTRPGGGRPGGAPGPGGGAPGPHRPRVR